MASVLAEIPRSDLDKPSVHDATITGLQHVASYNWLENPSPTISVPGAPPLWSPPRVPPTMTPDSGLVYIDQNAARNPRYPLEPLFRALSAHNPDFDLGNIDLVSDRNNIRKLLRFVQGSSTDDFEIRVEIAGSKTMMFTRVEPKAKDIILDFRGFGHNFEKEYTRGLPGSTGHHRIAHYHFGGMKCLVRYETDGYIDNKATPADPADILSDLLESVSISKPRQAATNQPVAVVKTQPTPAVDPASTLEIKTRAASRKLDLAETAPQLWISQTPILAIGYHRSRKFQDVQLRNVQQYIRDWEADNQPTLRKLAFLIKKVAKVVEGSDSRNAVVKFEGGAKLTIVRGEQTRALPDDLYSLWDAKEEKKGMGQEHSNETPATSQKSEPGLQQSKEDGS